MTPETSDFAIFGAPEGLAAPLPIVAERGPPSPQGTLDTSTGLTAPAGTGMEIPGADVLRDLQAEVISLRAQLAISNARCLVAAAPGGAKSTVAPTGTMTPPPGAGTDRRGQGVDAALAAVSAGLMNSPGLDWGTRWHS